ncbi:hypothetical protein M2451_001715 [Dysgonomonas sp. PFB1-18]|uniref:hypothetical protein n=1 Tax=unclassified Dysgonomonas TaxID=2630389 RepID=UPI002476A6BF|nr:MULTISPECIES: hypothetical protein [unclassified Dysgonomonas]MDH6309144.1 hypothetical protein [Dysgonomonas sp. PF1-14]MDH6338976.1 hypothetical protein [Dysgonomonas sp. PF1-16]MDH6380393.1 hypothetical protein [Dysgonomonas sp. PFB1-18]MDH6397804.1 hypothetical protein [Dysgonomonas sp. PF1-23]
MKAQTHSLYLLSILLSSFVYTQAQNSDSIPDPQTGLTTHRKAISIIGGYNVWKYHFLEIGLAANELNQVGHTPVGFTYYASSEIKIDKDIIIGPKVGFWFGGGLAFGGSLIYYTDFHNSSLRIRPEIGIGLDRMKVTYGYNIALTNKNFNGINKHNINFAFLIGIKNRKK